jgi:uncharacterized repeat protein (TIGR03837 family)
MNITQRRWDIFCRVIDNFGDIGVSWRLARQLAAEHGMAVRLWVDQLAALRALCPGVDAAASRQRVAGVEIFQFDDASAYAAPADAVVEAFGCGLPPRYIDALAAREKKPLWIVLEYLSAEDWVRGHHGLPSPHPRLGVPRYFFFPGFDAGTGGVPREADLLARRDAFDAAAKHAFWRRLGFDAPAEDATAVSLFAYPTAPARDIVDACAAGASPVVIAIPEGAVAASLREAYACDTGNRLRRGNVELRFVPFVPQEEYDSLLWACDINFVRGEDSFVRAQWAGKPFAWQIYPQAAHAHRVKLDAFLVRYCEGLPAPAARAVGDWWRAWNVVEGAPPIADAWRAFCSTLPEQREGLRHWQARLLRLGGLTGNLVKFYDEMI